MQRKRHNQSTTALVNAKRRPRAARAATRPGTRAIQTGSPNAEAVAPHAQAAQQRENPVPSIQWTPARCAPLFTRGAGSREGGRSGGGKGGEDKGNGTGGGGDGGRDGKPHKLRASYTSQARATCYTSYTRATRERHERRA